MIRAGCTALVLVALTHSVSCGHPSVISDEHAFYVEHEAYLRITKVRDLPAAVQSLLAVNIGSLADPGEEIRSVFRRSSLPEAGLTEAWCSPNHCIAQLEMATIFRRYREMLIGLHGSHATVEWAVPTFRPNQGLDALRSDLLADAGMQFAGR